MKTIDERFYNQGQSWHYVLIVNLLSAQRLRVSIRRNAYDFQSSAVCDLWDGSKWQRVNMMPIEDCACKSVSYIDKQPDKDLFAQDAKKLIAVAKQIVSFSEIS